MRYRLKALGADASVVETELEATSEAEARTLATARGLAILTLHASKGASRVVGRFPLLLFNQELLSLLRAGIPLTESISALAEGEGRRAVQNVLLKLGGALREGRTLSDALEGVPEAFPSLYVAMVRAAERTSDLDLAVERYIAYQQQVETLRGKLVNAAIYPVLLLAVGGLVVLFLLGYVVPRFSHIYEDIGGDLPWLSRALLEWGQFVEHHALALGVVVAMSNLAIVAAARNPAVWAALGRQLWKVPAIGRRLKVFQLARFYRTLGMLLSGGIPVIPALRMVTGLLSPGLRRSLVTAIEGVREGRSLSATLATHGLTTRVAIRMLEVGERAGNLGEMLTRTAEFHENETARYVEWLTRLVGPLLMLLMGCTIGFVVVLMYLPIFQLADSIG